MGPWFFKSGDALGACLHSKAPSSWISQAFSVCSMDGIVARDGVEETERRYHVQDVVI